MTDIMDYCEKSGRCYWEYVEQCEGKDINEYLIQVWNTMKAAVEKEPPPTDVFAYLNLRRKARSYYMRAEGYRDNLRSRGMVFSYALAVSEENASGGTIVTTPTCGRRGVVLSCALSPLENPPVLRHRNVSCPIYRRNHRQCRQTQRQHLREAWAAREKWAWPAPWSLEAACQLFGGTPAQIEYAAEMEPSITSA